MKMNNIYLPDGFPNTPDVKDLGGQYTAGDGIAFGSDGSINVDYGPGVTMTSVDKLTIDYGPGLDMTTTDKLTIKAGNGLQLSGADLAAKIGSGLSFGDNGAIKSVDMVFSAADLTVDTAKCTISSGGICVDRGVCYIDMVISKVGSGTAFTDAISGFPAPSYAHAYSSSTDLLSLNAIVLSSQSDFKSCIAYMLSTALGCALSVDGLYSASGDKIFINAFYKIKED